jgi:hypothetical protein
MNPSERQRLVSAPLEYPLCLCGEPMRLNRIEPHPVLDRAEAIFFECTACGHTLTEIHDLAAADADSRHAIPPRLSA